MKKLTDYIEPKVSVGNLIVIAGFIWAASAYASQVSENKERNEKQDEVIEKLKDGNNSSDTETKLILQKIEYIQNDILEIKNTLKELKK